MILNIIMTWIQETYIICFFIIYHYILLSYILVLCNLYMIFRLSINNFALCENLKCVRWYNILLSHAWHKLLSWKILIPRNWTAHLCEFHQIITVRTKGYRPVFILHCFIVWHFCVSFVENNSDRNKKTSGLCMDISFCHNTKENIGCPFRFFAIDWFLILPSDG